MGRFVVAVADVQALAVLHVLLFAREIPGRRGVLVGQGQSLGQLAAGVHPAGEHVHDGTGTGLPAQIGVQHCLAAADPARFHHAAGAQHHHEVLVGLRHSFQQLLLVLRDADVAAVQAFALAGLVQTHAEHHHVGLAGQCGGLFHKGRVGGAAALIPCAEACQRDVVRLGGVLQVVHAGSIHRAGACALIAGRLRKITDEGHALPGLEGQQVILVFQQHHAFGGGTAGQRMMGVPVEPLRCGLDCRIGGEHQLQQLVHPGIHRGFRQTALLHGLHQPLGRAKAGAGHFQCGAFAHTLHMVVGAAPVGDHGPVIAPLAVQDILQQVMVLVGVGAVDPVVGGHDALGPALFHGDLKAGEVQLPQGALVQHAVAGHAAQLLIVGGKVLGAGRNAHRLDAAHIACCQLAGQVRVLREILEIAAAQRAALGVQAGAQDHIDAVGSGLLAQRFADLLAQGGVPAVGHGGRRGEAGGRLRGVQAQMVGRARLLAQAVGAIRQPDGRHSLVGQGMGLEHGGTGKQGAFFPQGQFGDHICMFHLASPSGKMIL